VNRLGGANLVKRLAKLNRLAVFNQ
jgi:hypothetical protein